MLVIAASVGWMLLRRRAGAVGTLPGSPAPPPLGGSGTAAAARTAAVPPPSVLATDAGLTPDPAAPAPAPVAAAEPDTLATDAGLTPEPPAAPAPVAAAEPDTLATDAGLTPEPPAASDTSATDAGPIAESARAGAEAVGPGESASAPASPGVVAANAGLLGEPGVAAADPPVESEAPVSTAGSSDDTMVLPRVVDPDAPAPTGTDNLRAIRGIGPAIERTLHEFGITTYRQIAELHGEQLAAVRGRLESFSARIEREDWAGQARDLHREKYGD